MKIVCVDNFDRDNVDDSLVAENVPKPYAIKIVAFLNETYGGDMSKEFFQVESDDYKLYRFEP